MSAGNGIIKIGRKGTKKFAFGDGDPFEVDVVRAWQEWVGIDEGFRTDTTNTIKTEDMPSYHQAAVEFVFRQSGGTINADAQPIGGTIVTVGEALEFIAKLREQYEEVASFFQPKSPLKGESPDFTRQEILYSVEDN